MVYPASHRVPRVRQYSGSCSLSSAFVYGAFTLSGLTSQSILLAYLNAITQSSTPTVLLPSVCPLSISLAATLEISFDFSSSAYLDVSVQRVSPHIPIYSVYVDTVLPCRVSPFGNLRIYGHLHLPAAYRSLSRPSSAPNAKAFSMCSSSLDLVEANSALLRIIYLQMIHPLASLLLLSIQSTRL